jgi:hypothetical protein
MRDLNTLRRKASAHGSHVGVCGAGASAAVASCSPSPAQPAVPWARLLRSSARAGCPTARSGSPTWWARIAARSPCPNRPAVAACPSARSTLAGSCSAAIDRLGHLHPDPRTAGGGGLGQSQRRSVTEREEPRLVFGGRSRPRTSICARRRGKGADPLQVAASNSYYEACLLRITNRPRRCSQAAGDLSRAGIASGSACRP